MGTVRQESVRVVGSREGIVCDGRIISTQCLSTKPTAAEDCSLDGIERGVYTYASDFSYTGSYLLLHLHAYLSAKKNDASPKRRSIPETNSTLEERVRERQWATGWGENTAQTLHLLWLLFLCVSHTPGPLGVRGRGTTLFWVFLQGGAKWTVLLQQTLLTSLCFQHKRGHSPSWDTRGSWKGSDWWCVWGEEQENQLAKSFLWLLCLLFLCHMQLFVCLFFNY